MEFTFDNDTLPLTAELDPWLGVALLPAMQAGLDLKLTRPVSARLLQNLPAIQSIFNTWDATYNKIKVTAPARSKPIYDAKRKTTCFFSAGIDSFYTVLNHLDEIDVLIHLDNPWAGEEGRARMLGKIKEAAHRLGKELIIVKSNFRDFLDNYTEWDFSHGAALLTLAHLLAPYLSKVYMASAYTYADLRPNGTHPLLDYLWSTEDLEVVHDGADTHKYIKTHIVARNEIFLDCVRVCWLNIENEKNCGRCSKCLVTMVGLRLEGVLDRCPAFAVPLDLEYLANFHFEFSHQILDMYLDALESRGDDPELEAALRQALVNSKSKILAVPAKGPEGMPGSDEMKELRRKVAYYEQPLRFQIVDKVNRILNKNRSIHRAGEFLAHKVWHFLK
ncbi:MAG: hypothetical protein J0I20_21460 [Chloroflexi bacterium]|nr:hypothetical protein [Chloroflexota bacterium]OJV99869.1 MAG: hypothetical protein BGO39_29295 [Chloroflexi bacterium 54-19]